MLFTNTISAQFSLQVGDEVSEIAEIAQMPWRVLKRLSALDGFIELYANANADNESRMWSCDANVEFRVFSSKGDSVLASKNTGLSHFKANGSHLWGFKRFIAVEDLKRHFPEGTFHVEVHVTVHQMAGIRIPHVFAFDELRSPHADCALMIENEKIWISKSYLALYSPFFESLFFGDFAEKEKTEIEMKDISKDEFLTFLTAIYPSHAPVTEANVESLLRLADRFEVPFVTEKCEQFLLLSEQFSFAEKLLLSGQFRLCQLENLCLKEINSIADLKRVSESPEAEMLADFTKISLYERLVKLASDKKDADVDVAPRPTANATYKLTNNTPFVF